VTAIDPAGRTTEGPPNDCARAAASMPATQTTRAASITEVAVASSR